MGHQSHIEDSADGCCRQNHCRVGAAQGYGGKSEEQECQEAEAEARIPRQAFRLTFSLEFMEGVVRAAHSLDRQCLNVQLHALSKMGPLNT